MQHVSCFQNYVSLSSRLQPVRCQDLDGSCDTPVKGLNGLSFNGINPGGMGSELLLTYERVKPKSNVPCNRGKGNVWCGIKLSEIYCFFF